MKCLIGLSALLAGAAGGKPQAFPNLITWLRYALHCNECPLHRTGPIPSRHWFTWWLHGLQGGECESAGDGGQCRAEEAQLPKDIGLVMILKNENATIHETLTSIRDGIDYWTIVDTGSTGTHRSSSS